jgi:predicted 3-demethylubiquinone-9 3-methyltransferase (glyoxalase superfamily)
MAKVAPFLWFSGNMAEALDFYKGVFKDTRVDRLSPMAATFEVLGQKLMALNAPSKHAFNESISLFIDCKTQAEVDYYWNALKAGGGREQMCGWLKDRFGLSWQVIPEALGRYLTDKDRAKAERVMQAMLTMKRIVIADLDKAYAG